jgi:hypothetical protein
MRRRPDIAPLLAGLIAFWLLATAPGCSQNPRHNYAVASQTVAASLFAIQDAEEAAHLAGKITPAQHKKFNQVMAAALILGRDYNAAVRAWQPGTPPPPQLGQLKDALQQLSTVLIASFPPDVQLEIQKTITAAYDAVLAVILAAGA